jgi:hypothetical protein
MTTVGVGRGGKGSGAGVNEGFAGETVTGRLLTRIFRSPVWRFGSVDGCPVGDVSPTGPTGVVGTVDGEGPEAGFVESSGEAFAAGDGFELPADVFEAISLDSRLHERLIKAATNNTARIRDRRR